MLAAPSVVHVLEAPHTLKLSSQDPVDQNLHLTRALYDLCAHWYLRSAYIDDQIKLNDSSVYILFS